jgi:DNA helicase-2/ATP-dependent DNA helicase PcrA
MPLNLNYTQQLQRLNEYQKAAVFDESSACLVNANVGSGKTTVLITKVMYLHYEKQIPYEQMVVLTFTNKAADEIKERLYALEPEIKEEQLWGFGTFHSVCLTMLKKMLPVENLGYTKEFMVMDPDEELEMAEQLILTYQLKIKYKNRLKRRLEQKNSKYQDDIEKLKALLKEEKRRQDKMTFDELLDNTCKLVKMSAEIEEVSKKNANLQDNENTGMQDISWIIVDEVQDSDEKQLELIDCLKKTQTCFFAVGDPNQVIYSWRGSAFHIFYQLKTKYQATELTLPVNYRSSSEILAVARCFMQQGDTLQGGRENGDKIQIRNMYDPFQEADYLAGRIRELHASGLPYRETAVFYRLQNQSEIFEHVFEKEGIPFEVSLKKTVKDIPVLDWLIRVLRFSVNPKDKSSGIAALADKKYGDGMSVKVKEAEKTINILSENLKTQTEILKSENAKSGSDICEKMLEFSKVYVSKQVALPEDLWSYFSLENHLHPTTASYEEDRTYVMDFFTRMTIYQKEQQKNVVEGFSEFLNMASLYGMNILKKEIHNENDTVKLMTLHASKGLEFSHVFITGVNYGLIPLQTKSFEEEEEEQRLFFVGITRAKEHLELSYYTSPGQYRAAPGPSRYLRMIPGNLVEGQEKDKESSATHLQDLKRQILAERGEHRELQEAGKISGGKNPSANTGTKNISAGNETVTTEKRRVRHPKYGTGSVVREDDMMLTVDFDDYGEKELMKMFGGLEELS